LADSITYRVMTTDVGPDRNDKIRYDIGFERELTPDLKEERKKENRRRKKEKKLLKKRNKKRTK